MAEEIIEPTGRMAFDYSKPRPCKKCGEIFSGRGCQGCKNSAKRARRLANPEKEKPSALAYRVANREKIRLAAIEYRSKNPDRVKETRRAFYENHAVELRKIGSEYRAKNRALILQRAVEYRRKNKHKKRIAAKRYRAENPEKVKAQSAAWAAANPEANRVRVQNRRARRKANGGTLSKGLVGKLLVLQKGKCACCGGKLQRGYHLDHITPLAKGGRNEDENMQLLTGICNMQKHAKDPIDFMQERGFLL